MESIYETLSRQLGPEAIDLIQQRLGTDRATTERAVPAALGTLMGALAQNSARRSGAESLLGALERDHDGSVLDGIGDFLRGGGSPAGDGILRHTLGGNRARVEAGLGQSLGLDSAASGQLLALLAPLVMGALGRMRTQQKLDPDGLGSALGREREVVASRVPDAGGLLGSLLDRDGDGKVADDVASMGAGLLKRFLRRR